MSDRERHTHIHTHTHTYIYIYSKWLETEDEKRTTVLNQAHTHLPLPPSLHTCHANGSGVPEGPETKDDKRTTLPTQTATKRAQETDGLPPAYLTLRKGGRAGGRERGREGDM